MSKLYKIDRVVDDRWAVWYQEIGKKGKLGVYKIIDLYPGTRPTKFAFRWRVNGSKTQEQLDEQIINNAIRNFYKNGNGFRGNHDQSRTSLA